MSKDEFIELRVIKYWLTYNHGSDFKITFLCLETKSERKLIGVKL